MLSKKLYKSTPSTSRTPELQLRLSSQTNKTQLFDKLMLVFKKPRHERTEEDAEMARRALKEVPFFSSMQRNESEIEDLITETYMAMDYEMFEKGQAVFHYKDKGDKFYIILKGTVDVYMPKAEEELKEGLEEMENLIQANAQNGNRRESIDVIDLFEKSKSRASIKSNLPANESANFEKTRRIVKFLSYMKTCHKQADLEASEVLAKFSAYLHLYFDEVICKFKKARTMGPGSNFGELSLSGNYPRGATIVADSTLYVASLSKQAYMRVFEDFQRNLKEKMKFFSKLTGQDAGEAVTKFCYSFKERQYKYGQKIFSQGEIPFEAFVVKQGEIQIVTHETQDNVNGTEPSFMLRRKKIAERKIVNLGPYNLIGEIEALTGDPYSTTATSSTNETILYVIPIDELKSLKAKFPRVFERIVDQHQTKVTFREILAENNSTTKKVITAEYQNLISPDKPANSPFPNQSVVSRNSPRFKDLKFSQPASPRLQNKSSENHFDFETLQRLNSDQRSMCRNPSEQEDEPLLSPWFTLPSQTSGRHSKKNNLFKSIFDNKDGSPRKDKVSDQEKPTSPHNLNAVSSPHHHSLYTQQSHREIPGEAGLELPGFFQRFVNDTFRELNQAISFRIKSHREPREQKEHRELRPYEVDMIREKVRESKLNSPGKKGENGQYQFIPTYKDYKKETISKKKLAVNLSRTLNHPYKNCISITQFHKVIQPVSKSITPRGEVHTKYFKPVEEKKKLQSQSKPQINIADLELGSPFAKRKTPFFLSLNNALTPT